MKNINKIKILASEVAPNITLIDTHCHLDMQTYADDLDTVLTRARESRVSSVITIGIDLPSSRAAVALAQKHSNIFATIGVHPHDVIQATEKTYEQLTRLYHENKTVIAGYGEIGLDYVKIHSPVDIQKKHFIRQLRLASELELPVIIHNREADTDTYNILSKHSPLQNNGVMHCFSGDFEYAQKIIDLGMYISIPGIVTFKNAEKLKTVAKKIPLDRMLIETDGPFLAPHPFRGKRNEPAFVLFTATEIAKLRGISIEEIAQYTSENAKELFNLKDKKQ